MSCSGRKAVAPVEGPFPLLPLLPLLLLQGPPPFVHHPILQYNPVCETHSPCQSSSWTGLTGFLMQSRVPLGFSHRPSQARREATIRRTRACPQAIFAWLVERSPKGLRDPSEGSDLEGLGFWECILDSGAALCQGVQNQTISSLSSYRKEGEAANSLKPLGLRGPQASRPNELFKREQLYKLCGARLASL